MARIDQLLRYVKDQDGSDLHLAAGLRPHIRKHGQLEEIPNWQALTDSSLRELLREVASEGQWSQYEQTWDQDLAYAIEGVGRFPVNYFNQENGAGAVFRLIPAKIKTLDELGVPPALGALADLEQGLVLVTGPTGSGKSTTLAAIINRINESAAKHIVTIDDPVQFVHQNKKCTISQREIGPNPKTFGTPLRPPIRQHP